MTEPTVVPTEPTEPVVPTEPTKPIEPVVTTEPVVSTESIKPGETLITPPQDPATVKDTSGDKTKDGAPETYETFNLPDGVEMDKTALESFVPMAKQLGLSQEDAQALVDYEAKRVEEFVSNQETAWNDMQTEWRTATQSDKEIGGPAFDQSLAHAKKFLGAYGTAELIEALDSTGMGNHPEIIRAFSRAGKAMSEDTLTIGGVSTTKKSPEDILYPNQSET